MIDLSKCNAASKSDIVKCQGRLTVLLNASVRVLLPGVIAVGVR